MVRSRYHAGYYFGWRVVGNPGNRPKTGQAELNMFEVYLVSNVRWGGLWFRSGFVEPCPPFKIGYSWNPITRLETLKHGVPFNIMLVAVVQGFSSEAEAAQAEACILIQADKRFKRVRGEWFDGEPEVAWNELFSGLGGACLLQTCMEVDINCARLIPLPPDVNAGESFHSYIKARKSMKTAANDAARKKAKPAPLDDFGDGTAA